MRSSHSLDRLDTAFDDDRLVADAGLLLPATLAAHLGLRELVETRLDLGDRPAGRTSATSSSPLSCRRSRAVTVSRTPRRSRPTARDGPSASTSRRHRRWARSCAASAGATPPSSTVSAVSSSLGPRRPVPDRAATPSRSTSTRRSAKRTAGEGRCPSPRVHRGPRLSPAAARGRRRRRRRPHGPSARGTSNTRGGRPDGLPPLLIVPRSVAGQARDDERAASSA